MMSAPLLDEKRVQIEGDAYTAKMVQSACCQSTVSFVLCFLCVLCVCVFLNTAKVLVEKRPFSVSLTPVNVCVLLCVCTWRIIGVCVSA
mgnify:FL=1